MKTLSLISIILLAACSKAQTLEHSGSYAAYAVVNDTITLPDGTKALLKDTCYTDTIRLEEPVEVLAPVKTVFTGSSTAKLWPNLETTFGIPIIRRAWSGYGIMDIFYRVDTAVTAKNPEQIITYCGDNDFDRSDLTDSAIVARYKKLVDKITSQNPNARCLFVSVKPNPSKPNLTSRIISFNTWLEGYIVTKSNAKFVNTFPLMFSNETINMEMYEPGGSVHLKTPQGYDAWEDVIKMQMIKE